VQVLAFGTNHPSIMFPIPCLHTLSPSHVTLTIFKLLIPLTITSFTQSIASLYVSTSNLCASAADFQNLTKSSLKWLLFGTKLDIFIGKKLCNRYRVTNITMLCWYQIYKLTILSFRFMEFNIIINGGNLFVHLIFH